MSKIKSRILSAILALVCVVGLLPAVPAFAASSDTGGYAMSGSYQVVYSDASCTTRIGSIGDYEGLTVLYRSGNVAKVNYSTSSSGSGKTGFLKNPKFRMEGQLNTTCVGTVRNGVTVYGGPQAVSALKLGSLSSGEIVAVIYSESGWYYVEYNTTSGRKRGYVQAAYITAEYPGRLSGFPQSRGPVMPSPDGLRAQNVYGGPSEEYATVGKIFDNERVSVYAVVDNGMDAWYYIGYTASGYPKFGYILIH